MQKETTEQNGERPIVFVSYCKQPETNEISVRELCKKLERDGVIVIADIWDLEVGDDINKFIQRMKPADKVLIMLNRDYCQKVSKKKGGVYEEYKAIRDDMKEETGDAKYIPVVLEWDEERKPFSPESLKSILHVDMADDRAFGREYEKLLRRIYNKPNKTERTRGSTPNWEANLSEPLYKISEAVLRHEQDSNYPEYQDLKNLLDKIIDVINKRDYERAFQLLLLIAALPDEGVGKKYLDTASKLKMEFTGSSPKTSKSIGFYPLLESIAFDYINLLEKRSRLSAKPVNFQTGSGEQTETKIGSIFPTKTICRGKGIGFNYQDKPGFRLFNVSFELKEREILGVFGKNGSGKSTLLKIIAGIIEAGDGKITFPFLGDEDETDWYTAKQQIGYMTQHSYRWTGTLADGLTLFASFRGITGDENQELHKTTIQSMGLEDEIGKKWLGLSGGFMTRFQLARLLIGRPQLLILDEPMSPLDAKSRLDFLHDLRVRAKAGTAIIIASQEINEVEDYVDKKIYLEKGAMINKSDQMTHGDQAGTSCFELAATVDGKTIKKEYLDHLLKSFVANNLKTEGIGNKFILTGPQAFDSSLILKSLLKEPTFRLTHFKDISDSVCRWIWRT